MARFSHARRFFLRRRERGVLSSPFSYWFGSELKARRVFAGLFRFSFSLHGTFFTFRTPALYFPLVSLFFFSFLYGQENREVLEVSSLSISGNSALSDEEILNFFSTRETPNILSQGLYSIFGEKLGSPPFYFEPVAFEADVTRLKRKYHDIGYFDAVIAPQLRKNLTRKTVAVTLEITENSPTVIHTITYYGIDELPEKVRMEIISSSLLQKNSRFISSVVNNEISRVLSILQNSGYPLAQFVKDSSSINRYLSTNSVQVSLHFNPSKKMRFGTTQFSISSPTPDTIEYDVLLKQIDFQSGEVYNHEMKVEGERNLNRLGIFEAARIDAAFPNEGVESGIIPMTIVGKLRPKYDLAPELSFSDEDNAFNIGFGAGYTDRNFYGGARNFRSRLIFRFQSIQKWDFNSVFGKAGLRDPSVIGSIDLTFSLTQPYVFSRGLTGNTSLTFRAEKQPDYLQNIIRGKYGLTAQLATYTQGFFDWSLERQQVEVLGDSSQVINFELLKKAQFNSIFSVTMQRDKTNDIFSPSKGFFHSLTLEESGVIQVLIRNLQLDLPYTQFYNAIVFGRWYAETANDNFSTLAFKMKTGYQDKYGESKRDTSKIIPINRRFFSGGSGSVRGWRSRELGAMIPDLLPLGGNFLLEGNVEQRINVFRGFGKLWFVDLNQLWTVVFIDAGNVWREGKDFQFRDIAVATGFGIRYDTFFGPFRFDIGLKAYNPSAPEGKQTIFQKQFFGDTFKDAVYHFGIGHAF